MKYFSRKVVAVSTKMRVLNVICVALLCIGIAKAAAVEAETQSPQLAAVTTVTTPETSATSAAPLVVSTTTTSPTTSTPAPVTTTSESIATKNAETLVNRITTFVPILTAESSENITKIAAGPIKKKSTYDGDQVLRVFTVNSKHRKKVKEIERDGSKFYSKNNL